MLEEALREGLPEKEGARRSGRDTQHAIIEGGEGFALHLGGCDAALPAGCTHVVTLWDDGQEPPALNVGEGGADAPQRAVFPVRDAHDAGISQHFEGCCGFLTECAEAGGLAFVHCQMGRSRSATATIAFLMHRYRLPLLAAYGHVAALRNISALNYGFLARLTDAELRERRRDEWRRSRHRLDHEHGLRADGTHRGSAMGVEAAATAGASGAADETRGPAPPARASLGHHSCNPCAIVSLLECH